MRVRVRVRVSESERVRERERERRGEVQLLRDNECSGDRATFRVTELLSMRDSRPGRPPKL